MTSESNRGHDAAAQIEIVHVDDEPDFARLTATHLEREQPQLSVTPATTVAEALEQISPATDCLISDYQMQESTGLDLFTQIREQYPELPFILYTDTGSEAVASEALSAGVTDYLIKGVVAEQAPLLAGKITTHVEARRTKAQAERTERQLRELADQTDDVLWMFSADWSELQFVNAAYERVFEQEVSVLQQRPDAFLELLHPHDRDRVAMAMERVAKDVPICIEYRIETANSGFKWVESRAKAITEDGSVRRVVGFTRDITEYKQREQELEQKNAQLDRFASRVAHDVRNPLSVATSYVDLAREHNDDSNLETASDALGRIDEIVSDVLALAQAGDKIDARDPIALPALLQSCWGAVAHSDASLKIDTDLTTFGDSSRLSQVFENLFRNAVEHAGNAVTVRVGTLADGGGIYLEDDGPGIPPEDREAVLEDGYSTADDGTGFGLSIVEEVITAHGWDLTLTDSEAGGARFEIHGLESEPESTDSWLDEVEG